jgi:hypothetical protein
MCTCTLAAVIFLFAIPFVEWIPQNGHRLDYGLMSLANLPTLWSINTLLTNPHPHRASPACSPTSTNLMTNLSWNSRVYWFQKNLNLENKNHKKSFQKNKHPINPASSKSNSSHLIIELVDWLSQLKRIPHTQNMFFTNCTTAGWAWL